MKRRYVSHMRKVIETNKSHRESAKQQLIEKMKLKQQASNGKERSGEEGTLNRDVIIEPCAQQIEQLNRLVEKLEKAGAAKNRKASFPSNNESAFKSGSESAQDGAVSGQRKE